MLYTTDCIRYTVNEEFGAPTSYGSPSPLEELLINFTSNSMAGSAWGLGLCMAFAIMICTHMGSSLN